MSQKYQCGTPGRRQRLLELGGASPINGIDFVIVSDGVDVPDLLRQRVLRVRFFKPDGVAALVASNFGIIGGVRVEDPQIRWTLPMTEINAAGGPGVDPSFDVELGAAERTWLADLATASADPSQWFVIFTEAYGDFSQYELRLRAGPGLETPPGDFDLLLSDVEFSFKVECPTPFDCVEDDTCETETPPTPAIDYLARDYASFTRLMFERLALTQPQEPRRDPASLRTALVETLAYAADHVSYYLDAVNTEAYLGTARNRVSLRRHARLRDYHVHEGCNARTFVHLEVDGAAVLDSSTPPLVAAGTMLLSRVAAHALAIRPDAIDDALSNDPEVFEALMPVTRLRGAHNEIHLYGFGDEDCCLPAGATEATLADHDAQLGLRAGDFVVFEEVRDRRTGLEADADPQRRHVVRLVEVSASELDPLMTASETTPHRFVRIRWDANDALPFSLFLGTQTAPVTVVRGNLVLVDHGRSVELAGDEELPLEPFGHRGGLRARLPLPELTWAQPLDPAASARAALDQDPRQATPAISLWGEDENWAPRRDLLNSAPTAREFVVETETNRESWLRFGTDEQARRPAPNTRFTAQVRVGSGPAGNVGAHAIAHIFADPALVQASVGSALAAIRNPLAATGGQRPESIDEVKLYAPRAFRRQERAVTTQDWADVAARHHEVQRAVATIAWTGSWNTVFVSIDRVEGREFDAEFQASMLDYLDPFRMAGYELDVTKPNFVPLDIALTVCVGPERYAEDVARELYDEFSARKLAAGRLGFFHPDNLTFGRAVYLSQVIARVSATPGVRSVDATGAPNRFKRWGRAAAGEVAAGLIPIGRLEIPRCDNDRNLPDNGQIRFHMKGGA